MAIVFPKMLGLSDDLTLIRVLMDQFANARIVKECCTNPAWAAVPGNTHRVNWFAFFTSDYRKPNVSMVTCTKIS